MRLAFVLCAALLAACATETGRPGRLTARPQRHAAAVTIAQRGKIPIGSGEQRDGRLYIPVQIRAAYPVVLLLHGASGAGERIERRLQNLAEERGFIIV